MVDLEVEEDLNLLVGMASRAADGRPVWIRSAQRKSSLKMNEPFLLWVQRPSLSAPLFVAHVTREAWLDPGDLAPRLSRSGAG